MDDLAERVLAGDAAGAARLIRRIEERSPGHREALAELYPHAGRSQVVGITGFPGVGKSTLVDGLIGLCRQRGQTVGVLAVDPSSPYGGGAFLGDRFRMRRHALDTGVFIRSLATRGHPGGLSRAVWGAAMVLDALGRDVIFIETSGVGQTQVDVAGLARTTVVVTAPGLGDGIQALKAGLLEAADILVVNKADREGAVRTMDELGGLVELGRSSETGPPAWKAPVLAAIGLRGEGLPELLTAMDDHGAWVGLETTGTPAEKRRRKMAERTLLNLAVAEAVWRLENEGRADGRLDRWVDECLNRRTDPMSLVDGMLAGLGNSGETPPAKPVSKEVE
jgi:LAO/AO transport system kinase